MFSATVFTILCARLRPRCTLEYSDSGQQRLDRILGLISLCQLGVHDISRVELDEEHHLPRFNMPFEVGLFFGAKHFGDDPQKSKECLIFDSEAHRYDIFLSDISGCDPIPHFNNVWKMIPRLRAWLRRRPGVGKDMPPSQTICECYQWFIADFREACRARGDHDKRMPYEDYPEFTKNITEWLRQHLPSARV